LNLDFKVRFESGPFASTRTINLAETPISPAAPVAFSNDALGNAATSMHGPTSWPWNVHHVDLFTHCRSKDLPQAAPLRTRSDGVAFAGPAIGKLGLKQQQTLPDDKPPHPLGPAWW
jgi:hypothetical protein